MTTETQSLVALNYMPVMGVADAIARRDAIVAFTRQIMVVNTDYGVIPGTDKPTLLKPGAEKLCTLFGLAPVFEVVESITDWTGADHNGEPFFYFHYRCKLMRGDWPIGSGEGSCNSMEAKYRYRWVSEADLPDGINRSALKVRAGAISEPTFAIDKAETTGKYGKPAEYWARFKKGMMDGTARKVSRKTKGGRPMEAWEIDSTVYRVPNPDVADQVNTMQKMGQKRALIAATLIAVNASEFYTQDMEDFAVDPDGALQGSFIVTSTTTDAPPIVVKPEQGRPARPSEGVSEGAHHVTPPQTAPAAQPVQQHDKSVADQRKSLVDELTDLNSKLASAGLIDVLKETKIGNDGFDVLREKIGKAKAAMEQQPQAQA